MPHPSHTPRDAGDDLGSTDEVKVFKDEGEPEDEKFTTENLLVEEKSSLIDLTESDKKVKTASATRNEHGSSVFSKFEPHASFNMAYMMTSPYSYASGGATGLPPPPFFYHTGDHLRTPPPAHYGIPPYQLDPKGSLSLTNPAMYPFPSAQYPYPMLRPPDMSQMASWYAPSVYSAAAATAAAAASFGGHYPPTLPSNFPFRFPPSLLPSVHTSAHHVLNSHPGIVTTASSHKDAGGGSGSAGSQETSTSNNLFAKNLDIKNSAISQISNAVAAYKDNSTSNKQHHHFPINLDNKNSLNHSQSAGDNHHHHHEHHHHMSKAQQKAEKKEMKPHIKKPLNAFMLFMREMRAKVVAECTLKESAAINQILGRKWHELTREEQSKYYEKARQERQLHMELYPGWSARDNYGYVSKKKKHKKDRAPADPAGANSMKKCRARYGLDQQNQWCKPCRRKKKCIRYMEAIAAAGGGLGGVGAGGGGGSGGNSTSSTKDLDELDDGQRSDDDEADDDTYGAGSCGSGDDQQQRKAQLLHDHNESLNLSISSPGGLSVLSSLQSPSTSIASPMSLITTHHPHGNGLLHSHPASSSSNNTNSSSNEQQHQQQHHHHHHLHSIAALFKTTT